MNCQVFKASIEFSKRLCNHNSGKNLDLRLIRRICRWDLRDPHCYSNAVVYDVTYFAKGNLFQNVHFSLQDDLKSKCKRPFTCVKAVFLEVETVVNRLKILQYPNIRHRAPYRYCQYDKTHPRNFEPAFHCGQNPCDSCEAMRLARDWTNTCYEMQHRVCTRAEAEGKKKISKSFKLN